MRLLNLDLEKTTFIKNDDNTYTVYQLIGDSGVLKLPRVSIELKAEALVDNETGDFWQWINCKKKPSKISKLINGIKSRLRKKEVKQ